MKPTVEQIGALLALKGNESPDAGYWQEFLCEFHQNQREKAIKSSAIRNLFESLSMWFSDVGPSKWAYGAGVAYASVTVAFFLMPREAARENSPVSPVSYQVVPASTPPMVQQLDQLDLSPTTQGTVGEQIF